MSDKEDFYKFFSISKAPKDFKKKQELYKLFEVPKKELMPRFYQTIEGLNIAWSFVMSQPHEWMLCHCAGLMLRQCLWLFYKFTKEDS